MKIILLLISSSILAILCYGLFRYHVTDYYEFIRNCVGESFDFDAFYDDFEAKAQDIQLYSDEKEEVDKLKKLLQSHDKYTSVYLYDYVSDEYITGSYGYILDESINLVTPLSILQNDFEQYSYNLGDMRAVQFKDDLALVYVVDMHDLKYSKYYFYLSLAVCLLVFLLPTLIFVRRKVRYVNCLKNEILEMAHGDLSHPMTIQSYDELAILAKEMDSLRMTLDQNIQMEAQMKMANSELITSLSHDLRTPLTSLMGYLDILRLHRYQSDEQMNKYLDNCIEKVNQINDLSNKTFEYTLAFNHEYQVEFKDVSSLTIIHCLEENLEYLQLEGFDIQKTVADKDVHMKVNMTMIKRMINNLCSNIYKYASIDKPVVIDISIKQNQMKITLSNEKRKNLENIESNHIGLKSVKRIVELHQGELFIQNLENNYIVVITLPCLSQNEIL